ncbi:hypothetical protein EYR40_010468 [Pleurotus pulmonarius]|nr:hypothetical protein EYR40_010468 [Pleurotus pulmonarius]
MAHTNDSEVARLAEMVASLVVQLAALSPSPVASVASPREPATLGCEDYGEDSLSATSSAHRRWYVVIVRLQVGVFRGWTNTAPLVLGVAGSIYNREPTREAAIFAFNAAAAIGQVRLVD